MITDEQFIRKIKARTNLSEKSIIKVLNSYQDICIEELNRTYECPMFGFGIIRIKEIGGTTTSSKKLKLIPEALRPQIYWRYNFINKLNNFHRYKKLTPEEIESKKMYSKKQQSKQNEKNARTVMVDNMLNELSSKGELSDMSKEAYRYTPMNYCEENGLIKDEIKEHNKRVNKQSKTTTE